MVAYSTTSENDYRIQRPVTRRSSINSNCSSQFSSCEFTVQNKQSTTTTTTTMINGGGGGDNNDNENNTKSKNQEFLLFGSTKNNYMILNKQQQQQQQQQITNPRVSFSTVQVRKYKVVYDSAADNSDSPFPLALGWETNGQDETFNLDDYELSKIYLSPRQDEEIQRNSWRQSRLLRYSASQHPQTRRYSASDRYDLLVEMGYSESKLHAIECLRQLQLETSCMPRLLPRAKQQQQQQQQQNDDDEQGKSTMKEYSNHPYDSTRAAMDATTRRKSTRKSRKSI